MSAQSGPAAPQEGIGKRALGERVESHTEYRFGLVLLLLLITFMFMAAGPTGSWTRLVLVLLQGATLVAALFAAHSPHRLRLIAVVVTLVAFVAALASLRAGESTAGGAMAVINAALVGIAPVAIAASVVRRRVIDIQTILAALCIYVLLGMLWAFVFTAIGAFGSAPFFAQPITATSADYLYFSFITQTTVGYGDLSAAGNLSRACAVLEALIGQIYLVTVVALLVSNLGRSGRITTGEEPET